MKQIHKAPGWVMAGVLAVILLSCIPGIMLMMNLITPETITFSNEYGESASSSNIPGIWMLNIIAILFFVGITILTFVRNWSKAVATGGIMLIMANVAGISPYILYSTASSYQELITAFSTAHTVGIIEMLLFMAGNLIIAFNTSISSLTRILFTVFIVIFSLIFLIPFPPSVYSGISNTLMIVKPIFAAVLLYLCVMSKQEQVG